MYEVTTHGDIIVPIKDYFGGIRHYDRLYMLEFVAEHFALQMLHTGSIDCENISNKFQI